MTEKGTKEVIFAKQKQACLAGIDFSRKGSIDDAISDLVHFINLQEKFVTTSSCSGRITVFSYPPSGEVQKKGCKWLHITHDYCSAVKVMESIKRSQQDIFFKFEAFVLHVQCAALEPAQRMMATAVASGFRNSGISVSNKGKIIVAVRSTHSLEAPLTHQGKLLVSEEYVEYLVELGNRKMKENFERIERFFSNLKKNISNESAVGVKKKLSGAAKRKKKLSKTFSDNNIWEIDDLGAISDKMEEVAHKSVHSMTSTANEEIVNPRPLPKGFVSFNKVTSLQFTTQNRSGERGCQTKEHTGVANESETCVEVNCISSVESQQSKSSTKDLILETDTAKTGRSPTDSNCVVVRQDTASHSSDTGDGDASQVRRAGKLQEFYSSESATCWNDATNISRVIADGKGGLPASGRIDAPSKPGRPWIVQNNLDSNSINSSATTDSRGNRETPPMAVKGITAVTVISPGCLDASDAVKQTVVTQKIEDSFDTGLCLNK